jgi:protein-disulfide isomerase
MNSEEKVRSYFLIGIGVLTVLIIGGLIWAIASGPDSGSRGGVEYNLKFKDDNDPAQGPAESKVVVRVFGDLQCPSCAAAEAGLKYAMKTYGDKVRFIWNDFPLTQLHPNAMNAAQAARCAEEQGKFWEYADLLYTQQSAWEKLDAPVTKFTEYAKALSLREDTFNSCFASQTYRTKILDDMDEGNANDVNATPTFFINNKRFVGVMTEPEWDQAIQGELTGASSK